LPIAAHGFDEIAEVRDHFRRAAGQVDAVDVRCAQPVEDAVDRLAGNNFLAPRPRVDVAVYAGEVAKAARVELQDLWFAAAKTQAMADESSLKVSMC
jgi:hypothetical protein